MVGGEQLKGPGEDVKGQCHQIVYLLNPSTSFGPLIFGHHIGTNINFSFCALKITFSVWWNGVLLGQCQSKVHILTPRCR